jgi:hypothetical protein
MLFLDVERFGKAEAYFMLAGRQWRLSGNKQLDMLAKFAQALALHQLDEYDRAVEGYLEVQHYVDNNKEKSDAREFIEFFSVLEEQLQDALILLQEGMREAYQIRSTHVAEVAEPVINLELTDSKEEEAFDKALILTFDYKRSLFPRDLQETVLSVIVAISQINRALNQLRSVRYSMAITILRLNGANPLEVLLGNALPVTEEVCRMVFMDPQYRSEQESKLNAVKDARRRLNQTGKKAQKRLKSEAERLQLKKLESALLLAELEIDAFHLKEAKELVKANEPADITSQKRREVTANILESIRSLRELSSLELITVSKKPT